MSSTRLSLARGIVLAAILCTSWLPITRAQHVSQVNSDPFSSSELPLASSASLLRLLPESVLSTSAFDTSVLLLGRPESSTIPSEEGSIWMRFDVQAVYAAQEAGLGMRKTEVQGFPLPSMQLILDSTYHFVARYDFSGTADSLFLWVNPAEEDLADHPDNILTRPPSAAGSEVISIQFETANDTQSGYAIRGFQTASSLERIVQNRNPEIPGLKIFESRQVGQYTILEWEVEKNVPGHAYVIEMLEDGAWQAIDTIREAINADSTHYRYRLPVEIQGEHRFRLRLDEGEEGATSGILRIRVERPIQYHLGPAYPNPFNPSAQFTLEVVQTQYVQVTVYDALGREVERLFEGTMPANEAHQFHLDGSNWPSGIYHYEVQGAYFRDVRRVVLAK